MSETWVNIYLWVFIGSTLITIFLLVFRPLSRMFGKPNGNDEATKADGRKLLIREFCQLLIGVIALVLFKLDVLKGWAVLGFCTVLLVGVVILFRFIKPVWLVE